MIAIVTGANRGIGLEVTRQLALLGYTVILGSRNQLNGEQAKADIGNPDNVIVHELDVSSKASVQKLAEFIRARFGQLNVLVNNAGINYDTWNTVLNSDLNEIRQTLETNVLGAWAMIQSFGSLLELSGNGRIVNVSSGAGAIQGMSGGTPGYSMSKTAMNVLTIKAAAELRSKGILVNSVCPGWVRTDMGGSAATRSVEKGAETIVWAATLDSDGPTGRFFRDKREISF